jgi:Zn-finger nucleic acid-binding protein
LGTHLQTPQAAKVAYSDVLDVCTAELQPMRKLQQATAAATAASTTANISSCYIRRDGAVTQARVRCPTNRGLWYDTKQLKHLQTTQSYDETGDYDQHMKPIHNQLKSLTTLESKDAFPEPNN